MAQTVSCSGRVSVPFSLLSFTNTVSGGQQTIYADSTGKFEINLVPNTHLVAVYAAGYTKRIVKISPPFPICPSNYYLMGPISGM